VVPYENEIKGLVFDAHRSTSNHYDIKETKNKLKASGIFWIGMKKRIEKELKICSCKLMICIRSNTKKVSVYRKIDSQKPRERFQADTTVIPFMIVPSKQYLLNIKDHFSRFVWSFLN